MFVIKNGKLYYSGNFGGKWWDFLQKAKVFADEKYAMDVAWAVGSPTVCDLAYAHNNEIIQSKNMEN